jgi:hypothetical protein
MSPPLGIATAVTMDINPVLDQAMIEVVIEVVTGVIVIGVDGEEAAAGETMSLINL